MTDLKMNSISLLIAIVIFHVLSYFTHSMNDHQLLLSIGIWLLVGCLLIFGVELKTKRQRTKEVS
ncbi:hypothetical protein [Kurthia huakuii]|uniref:hypothetical protein n=1 Tax=Kurthia huakuii TaxID=1421019 RepID=UPI000496ADAA|nr:hypothetical protein [Kurthia huakuii]MBM7698641.1 L-cystine uptake protein TcyP (sodium:dicarboxylate symporter family) [Kurthia huakuii]